MTPEKLTVTFRGSLGTPFFIIPTAPNSQDWPSSPRRSVEDGCTLGTCLAFLFHSNWPLWSDSFCVSSLTHSTVENVLFSQILLDILPNVEKIHRLSMSGTLYGCQKMLKKTHRSLCIILQYSSHTLNKDFSV